MSSQRRRYRSHLRTRQAEGTRRSVLEAAVALFTELGFAKTSVRQVAERARVSEQTVYNAFGDKVGLLHAAGAAYAELSAGQEEAAFVEALKTEPDAIERLRMVARASRQIWEGGAVELERLVFQPQVDDQRLVDLAKLGLAHKHSSNRAVCEVLFPDGIRRPGLELDTIIDFATAVDSAATVTTLRSLGWSMDDWEAWLVELLTLFLDPTKLPAPSDLSR